MKHLYLLLLLVGQYAMASNENCILSNVINLDSTAIRTLNSTPALLIPQPPSNHYVQIVAMDADYTSGTTAYLGSPILIAYYLGNSDGTYFSLSLTGGTQLTAGTGQLNDHTIIPDAPVLITLNDSDRTVGNGSLKIIITYRYVSLTGVTACDTTSNTPANGSICTEIVHVTSAQILTCATNPPVIIPNSDPTKFINILAAQIKSYGATPYTTNTLLRLFFKDSLNAVCGNSTALLRTDTMIESFGLPFSSGTIMTGTPLRLGALDGNPTLGTGSFDLIITYVLTDPDVPACFGGGGGSSGAIDVSTTQSSHTGTTSNTLVYGHQIAAGTFAEGDWSEVDVSLSKIGANGEMTTTLWINTTNSLSGATKIATWTSSNISNSTDLARKRILWRSGGFNIFDPNTTNYTDLNSADVPRANITYNVGAPMYWIAAIQLQNASDEGILEGVIIKNYRK